MLQIPDHEAMNQEIATLMLFKEAREEKLLDIKQKLSTTQELLQFIGYEKNPCVALCRARKRKLEKDLRVVQKELHEVDMSLFYSFN